MKKFLVNISFEIDTSEYNGVRATEAGVKKLVKLILDREADMPDDINIVVSKKIDA